MVFDTGAEISIINQRVFNGLGGETVLKLKKREQDVKAYGNINIDVLGETEVLVRDNEREMKLPVIVTKGTNPCIYGCNWIRQLRPEFTVNSINSQKATLVLKDNAKSIFLRP